MSGNEFSGIILRMQKGRQLLAVRVDALKQEGLEIEVFNRRVVEIAVEIAKELVLSLPLQFTLGILGKNWRGNKPGFYAALLPILMDGSVSLEIRALVAEYLSSAFGNAEDAFDVEGAIGFSLLALEWAEEMGGVDGKLIECKVNAGLIDRKMIEFTLDYQREIIEFMIEVGSFDAPGRVKAWLESFDADEQLKWLERVTAMDPESTAANIYYLGWCENKLIELKG